jgi:hypothetical protein
MQQTELVRTGAAATRRLAKKNPMEVLADLLDGDRTADRKRLFRMWWEVIRADDEYLTAVGLHTFTNLLSALDRDQRNIKRGDKQSVAEQRIAISKLVEKARNIILLDLVLPNGKKLRHATFAECSAAGGWFKLLAARGKPSEVVGRVLSESDLRALR